MFEKVYSKTNEFTYQQRVYSYICTFPVRDIEYVEIVGLQVLL